MKQLPKEAIFSANLNTGNQRQKNLKTASSEPRKQVNLQQSRPRFYLLRNKRESINIYYVQRSSSLEGFIIKPKKLKSEEGPKQFSLGPILEKSRYFWLGKSCFSTCRIGSETLKELIFLMKSDSVGIADTYMVRREKKTLPTRTRSSSSSSKAEMKYPGCRSLKC